MLILILLLFLDTSKEFEPLLKEVSTDEVWECHIISPSLENQNEKTDKIIKILDEDKDLEVLRKNLKIEKFTYGLKHPIYQSNLQDKIGRNIDKIYLVLVKRHYWTHEELSKGNNYQYLLNQNIPNKIDKEKGTIYTYNILYITGITEYHTGQLIIDELYKTLNRYKNQKENNDGKK